MDSRDWPAVGSLVECTGCDYSNSFLFIGQIGRVVEHSTMVERCEVLFETVPMDFLPYRTWIHLDNLQPYQPAPLDDPEGLVRWLAR